MTDSDTYIPTVCIDLNGVLDEYAGWAGGKMYLPRDGAQGFLMALKASGYRIVIFTTVRADAVWQWLDENLLRQWVDDVTDRKVPALCYVDDRAICFRGDYAATLNEIHGFKAHWEAPA